MSSYTVSLFIDIQSPANFHAHHTTIKLDSIKESVFQRIGLACREFDVIASQIAQNPYAAKAHLTATLLNNGLSKDHSELLLAATNWEDRMRLTWTFLQASDRRKARSLNYDVIENYWPTSDFLDAKWPSAFKALQAA
jgi:hypothetical protein